MQRLKSSFMTGFAVVCLSFALGLGQTARASEATDLALVMGSTCLGVGTAAYALADRMPLVWAIPMCLGAALPTMMPLMAMPRDSEARVDMVPLVSVPFGLIGLAAGASLFVPNWGVDERTRLVSSTVTGVGMGLAIWAAGGMITGTAADGLRLTAPTAILAAAGAGLATGAGAFALGTTDRRRHFLLLAPLAGLSAGMLGVATYTLVKAARGEPGSSEVLGGFMIGGLVLGSVTGLVMAALSPASDPGDSEQFEGGLAISPVGLSLAF